MLDMGKKYALVCCALLLTACNESYPGLYAPVVDADNPNPEVTEDLMPIKLSATDPSFDIVTRGLGAFESWSDEANRERWRKADFYVYAFLANNHEFTGSVNYAGEEVNLMLHNDDGRVPHCLVKNRKVKFTNAPEPTLEWVQEEEGVEYQPYYSVSYPDYKFNFFVYHVDNALCGSPVEGATQVAYHITIDGTQDIISGFAHDRPEDVEKLENYDSESLNLLNHWSELIYSTRTANRGILPRLYLTHHMARLNFSIRGNSQDFSNKIQVMAVGVYAPVEGIFTVARDWQGGGEWEDSGMPSPQLGVVWDETKTDTMFLSTSQTPEDVFGATYQQSQCLFEPSVSVEYNQEKELGEILLPPAKSYGIFVRYKMVDRPNEIFTANYSRVGFGEENREFLAGTEYNVSLGIYGPQSIGLEVDGCIAWNEGGDITVDGEDM